MQEWIIPNALAVYMWSPDMYKVEGSHAITTKYTIYARDQLISLLDTVACVYDVQATHEFYWNWQDGNKTLYVPKLDS